MVVEGRWGMKVGRGRRGGAELLGNAAEMGREGRDGSKEGVEWLAGVGIGCRKRRVLVIKREWNGTR